MRIASVAVSTPSWLVSNEQIIDLIREHSRESFDGDLEHMLLRVDKLLRWTGARTRRWLAEGERPIEHIETAVRRALTDAEVKPDDVDLLIYVGVGKGFMEPGQSYMVAHALGMHQVECFDLLDGCMSWTRAAQVAESLLLTGRHQRILIVNGEFHGIENGRVVPDNFRLESFAQLSWTLPTYTIGHAATAALVVRDSDNPWTWRFESRPELAHLCTIPACALGSYSAPREEIGKNGLLRFTSYGKELLEHAREPCIRLLRELLELHPDVGCIIPHASSHRDWDSVAQTAGVPERVRHIYPEYGNLVSASVPAGLAMAWAEGLVQRGDRVAGWMASAGMSFAAYSFRL